jgi:hypothetical protein
MCTPVDFQSDQQCAVILSSRIIYAAWGIARVFGGACAEIEVRTAYVGENAPIQIRVFGESSGALGGVDDTIFGNRYIADIPIPASVHVDDKIWFIASLPRHGLSAQSEKIPAVPPIQLVSISWGQQQARRGDVIDLRAEFLGLRDIVPCEVHILEYDSDGNHDPINRIPSEIRNGRLNLQWEYEYHEDTDEIPTEEELQHYGSHYNPPEYFFVVEIDGQKFGDGQESGLLRFSDWVEVKVTSGLTKPLEGADYTIYFPDGTTQAGVVDGSGLVRIENVGPGKVYIEFSDFTDIYQVDEKFSLEQINKRDANKYSKMNPIDDNEMLPLASKFSITGKELHLAVLCTASIFVIDPNSDAPMKEGTVYTIENANGTILHTGSVGCHGLIQWTGLPIGSNVLKIADYSFEFESQVGDQGFITVDL